MRSTVVRIDPEELRELWSDERFTLLELGLRFGCSDTTISSRARELGLPRRKAGGRRPPSGLLAVGKPLTGGRWLPNGRGIMVWVRDGG